MPRLVVFDLDGTLVDSAPDIHAALDRLMAARGRPGFTRAEVTAMIGDGVAALVARATAARGLAGDAAMLAAFTADYTARAAEATVPFPGILAALDALETAGWALAICTNKPVAATRALLDALGLAGRFRAIGGGDSFAVRKPDPAHLLGTLALCGAAPAEAVMVGDHRNDMRAALGAGVPGVFAGWGYGTPDMAAGAVATAGHPAALPTLLRDLRP